MDKRTYFGRGSNLPVGRGPNLPDSVIRQIAEIYLQALKEDPGITAKEVVGKLHRDLQSKGEQLRPGWPGESRVSKELTKIRKTIEERPPELKELDKPWSIGALAKYPIPPECLPVVLRAFYAERRTDAATDEYFRIGYEFGHKTYLTIREALWIARLSPLFKYPTLAVSASPEQDIAQYAKFDLVTAKLVQYAHIYALEEMMTEIMEKPLDTSNLDIGFYLQARDEIYRSLVSVPRLIKYSWEDTQNHLKKEGQNER